MHGKIVLIAGKIFIGGRVRIGLSLIDLGGGDAVHHHLRQIIDRHLYAHDLPVILFSGHIRPVFKMMLIAALMVKPSPGKSLFFLFRRVGAPVALIIQHAGAEFLPGILGQIMEKSLFP